MWPQHTKGADGTPAPPLLSLDCSALTRQAARASLLRGSQKIR
jgi:hypothetical protein